MINRLLNQIAVNGVAVGGTVEQNPGSTLVAFSGEHSGFYDLNANDYVEVLFYAGDTLDSLLTSVSNRFELMWIRSTA